MEYTSYYDHIYHNNHITNYMPEAIGALRELAVCLNKLTVMEPYLIAPYEWDNLRLSLPLKPSPTMDENGNIRSPGVKVAVNPSACDN